MKYKLHSFRHALAILDNHPYSNEFNEVLNVLDNITDNDIIKKHESYGSLDIEGTPKSISRAINDLIKERLLILKWQKESKIFQNPDYSGDTWRLDFAKEFISLEVAFNHGTVIAWNLIKPVLASELNHVQKAIQTEFGVIITVTDDMKKNGGFDGAIGYYEKFLEYLPPLQNLLTVPMVIIGLESPDTFKIIQKQYKPRKKIGIVEYI